tara:strand:- start:391 stop:2136 length:1746 start_codon:yes stop_codon:yes gene_type:complete
MSDLKNILNEEYEKKQSFTPVGIDALIQMISEALDMPAIVIEEEQSYRDMTFTLEMIPEIEVSELGWSDVRTPEGGGQPIKGRERQLLENYLANILGVTPETAGTRGLESLPDQLRKLSNFAADPSAYLEKTGSRKKQVQQAISLLVFYKTLTKIIANFNASSAGFSFESFLATLLNGVQIPASGAATIADFYAGGVDGTPVSLKLYNEGSVEVGGSFADLVGDLLNDSKNNEMTYLVVMKNLRGAKESLSGTLSFYQFKFDIHNVMAILGESKASSRACCILPIGHDQELEMGQSRQLPDVETPARIRASNNDIQAAFAKNLSELAPEYAAMVLPRSESDYERDHFKYGTDEYLDLAQRQGALRRYSDLRPNRPAHRAMAQILRGYEGLQELPDDVMKNLIRSIDIAMRKAVDVVLAQKKDRKTQIAQVLPSLAGYKISKSAKDEERAEVIARIERDAATSVKFYNDLEEGNVELRKQALMKSNGYLNELQFSLNRTEVQERAPLMAILEVGPVAIQKMLNDTRELLNSQVFEIFESLRNLSDNLNGFFASGLADGDKATAAIGDAQKIETKTKKAKSDK